MFEQEMIPNVDPNTRHIVFTLAHFNSQILMFRRSACTFASKASNAALPHASARRVESHHFAGFTGLLVCGFATLGVSWRNDTNELVSEMQDIGAQHQANTRRISSDLLVLLNELRAQRGAEPLVEWP